MFSKLGLDEGMAHGPGRRTLMLPKMRNSNFPWLPALGQAGYLLFVHSSFCISNSFLHPVANITTPWRKTSVMASPNHPSRYLLRSSAKKNKDNKMKMEASNVVDESDDSFDKMAESPESPTPAPVS